MGGSVLVVSLCLAAAFWQVEGQTCSNVPQECYFDKVATIGPSVGELNKYFVIGGLFDLHGRMENAIDCSADISNEGMINMLAFFWGIDRFFRGNEFTAVSVKGVAFDNCMRPEQTIENLLGFAQCKTHIQGMHQQNLVAYVGPYTNKDLIGSAQLATDIGVTLVSPTADAVDLNVAGTTTLLTSPSFTYDINAMTQLLGKLSSSYVIVLYSGSDPFYASAYTMLMSALQQAGVCVSYSTDIDKVKNNLGGFLANNLSVVVDQKYVIPLMSKETLHSLLAAVKNNDVVYGKLRFILNSHIGADLPLLVQYAESAKDAIVLVRDRPWETTGILSKADLDAFINYVNAGAVAPLATFNDPMNWVAKGMQGFPTLTVPGPNDPATPLVDAAARTLLSLKIIEQGMKAVIADCSDSFCDKYRNQRNKDNILYNQFKNGYPGLFNANTGQLAGSQVEYTYFHMENPGQVSQPTFFNNVGTFRNGQASNDLANLKTKFGNAFQEPTCNIPEICCVLSTTTPATTPAASTTPAPATTTPAVPAYSLVYYKRDEQITGAYPYTEVERSLWDTRFDDGNHKWIIALGVLAGLGILCVLVFEIYILFKLLGTRIGHQWRTMWLGQLLLFGILVGYLTLFAYMFTPTKETCGITRFGVGVSYAICFAVLLVKLMVILTSKTSDVLLPGDESPNYLKGVYQFLMFIFAVGVQVVIDVQWLILVPPEAVQVTSNNGNLVWICNHYTWQADKGMTDMSQFVRTNFENHVLSLVYIMAMILITTILSLNAHGIITNHRESVFIGISAGFSIPIWLAWTLVGGLNYQHAWAQEFGDACMAFGLLLTLTLILFAMFLPKVRQLVNMGVEGIYLEDDRDTYYAGSVIMAPPSYKKGPPSVIYVNNQGIYSEPVVIGNGDPSKEVATHLKHPGSTYSAPPTYLKRPESAYGSTRVLRVTDDLKGRHPQKRPQSEVAYGTASRPRSHRGTLPRSRSQTDLGAL